MPYKDPEKRKEASRKGQKVYYWKHREEIRAKIKAQYPELWATKQKAYHYSKKVMALSIVAGSDHPVCVNCGCDDIRILEINHKNGRPKGSYKDSKESSKHHGSRLWWAIACGDLDVEEFDVRCRLCNILHFVERKFPDLIEHFQIIFSGNVK